MGWFSAIHCCSLSGLSAASAAGEDRTEEAHARDVFEESSETCGVTIHSGVMTSLHTAQNIMKTRYVGQRFVSGLLVILSITTWAMLLLQVRTPGIAEGRLARLFQSGGTVTDAYALFNSGALSRAASGPAYL